MTCASSERPGEYLRGQCTLECTSRPAGGIRRNIIYFIALFVLTSPPPPPPPPPPRSPLAVHAPSCPSRVATNEARFDRVACNPCFFHTTLSLSLFLFLSPSLSSLYSCRVCIYTYMESVLFFSLRTRKKGEGEEEKLRARFRHAAQGIVSLLLTGRYMHDNARDIFIDPRGYVQ